MSEIDPRINILKRWKSMNIMPAISKAEYWNPKRVMKGVLKMALSASPGRCSTCKTMINANELYNDHNLIITHKKCRLTHEDLVKLLDTAS